MGFFSFGSSSKSSKSTTHQTQTETKTGTSTTDQSQQQQTQTSTLDAGVRDALSQFITSSLATVGGAGATPEQLAIRDLASTMADTATGAADALTSATTAIVNEARRSGQRDIQRLQTDTAQASGGSTDNTFVLGATAEANAALESSLAGLGGQLALQIHQMQGEDFKNAVAALTASAGAGASGNQGLAYLVDALKGGATTGTTTASGHSTTVDNETLSAILDSLTKGKEKSTSFSFGLGKS